MRHMLCEGAATPLLWDQTRPKSKDASLKSDAPKKEPNAAPPAAAADPNSQHQHPSTLQNLTRFAPSAQKPARWIHKHLIYPYSDSFCRTSYLKLAGEFTWMLRPDGGVAFRFSLSAMPPRVHVSTDSADGVKPPGPTDTWEVRRRGCWGNAFEDSGKNGHLS